MKSMTLGRYTPYNSPIHRLDPRIKLFGMVLLMVAVFIKFATPVSSNMFPAMNFIMYGIILAIILILMAFSHISLLMLFKQLKALWLMIVFLLIVNVLMPNTGSSFNVWFLRVYWNAIWQTLYIVIRLILMVGLTMVLTSTTRPLDLTYAIEWFLAPLKLIKFPVAEIAMTISIALRFIPTLLDETNRIMKAQESRGVDFKNGKMKEKIRAVISLIVPLFISAFQRSEELANAMEARGYDPSAKRTRYRVMKWKFRDTVALVLVALFFAGVIVTSVLKLDFVVLLTPVFETIMGWF